MDKEQEQLQLLGFIGIFKESIKIILSHPKIFTKISFAFILPITLITLVNNEISKFFSNKMLQNLSTSNTQGVPHNNVPSLFSSKWILYWGLEAFYFIFIFVIIFSLLSISAVVYTVACIYTGKEVTFKEVMTAVPKVWKRLMITLASNFCVIFAYTFSVVVSGIFVAYVFASKQSDKSVEIAALISTITIVLLFVGVMYVTVYWQLANVISVMEDCYGFQAMKKSRNLIKGNLGSGIAILLVLSLCSVPILALNQQIVSSNIGVGLKMLLAILVMVLNPLLTLYSLVVQTVFYCVCKSYHHESINKATLVDHLEALLGDYVPLMSEVVEIV